MLWHQNLELWHTILKTNSMKINTPHFNAVAGQFLTEVKKKSSKDKQKKEKAEPKIPFKKSK